MSLMRWARDALAPVFAKRYKTMFGTAKVYETSWEDTRIRVLEVDGTYQSASYLGERWCEVPFPYLALYDAIFNTDTHMNRICMLGGGGFAFPKHVVAHRSPTIIDVVEIDPAIIRIANEHFFLDKLEETYHATEQGRLAIHCGDALAYLEECKRAHTRYGAILNDCFAGVEANDELASDMTELFGENFKTPSLVFLDESALKLYFEKKDPAFDTTGLTPWNNYFVIQKRNIPAKELDTLQNFRVNNKDIKYSALDYAKVLLATDNADYQSLAKAMYWYNQAANVYFD